MSGWLVFLFLCGLTYLLWTQGPSFSRRARLRRTILEHLALVGEAQLPLAPGLLALARERAPLRWWGRRRARREAELIRDLAARVEASGSLASAFAAAPRLFPAGWVELVQRAEAQGALAGTLARLHHEEHELEHLRWRCLEWLAYPSVVGALVAGVSVFLQLFVLPKLDLIARASSLAMDGRSSFAAELLCQLLCLALCGVLGLAWAMRRGGRPRRWLGLLGARLPGLGAPLRQLFHARWLRQAGALLQAGATWGETLDTLAATEHGPQRRGLERAGRLAHEGQPLEPVLREALGRDARRLLPGLLFELGRQGGLAGALRTGGERLGTRALQRLERLGELGKVAPVLFCAAVVGAHVQAVWQVIFAVQTNLTRSVF